tara:strand:- start:2649 stop:3788 length:1140 start_codon:yes stop_codon:yes gene_type:complete
MVKLIAFIIVGVFSLISLISCNSGKAINIDKKTWFELSDRENKKQEEKKTLKVELAPNIIIPAPWKAQEKLPDPKILFTKKGGIAQTVANKDGIYGEGLTLDQFSLSENDPNYQLLLESRKGNVSAQTELADNLFNSASTQIELTEAINWYSKAAEKGSAYAAYMLSIVYQNGYGIKKSANNSIKWYNIAETKPDSVVAKLLIAKRYLDPNSSMFDEKRALWWMEVAASKNNIDAQNYLGDMYALGIGTSIKPLDALKWYGMAAARGSAYAQYSLGVLYYNGTGIPKDYTKAVKWSEYAAKQGLVEAQYLLSEMYYEGLGVKKSNIDAYAWLKLAKANENIIDPKFDNMLNNLMVNLSPSQLQKAIDKEQELRLRFSLS